MYTRVKLNWKQIEEDINELASQIDTCSAIVAIGRGGLVPGTILSYILDCELVNFGIKSYNKDNIAEDSRITQIPGIKFNNDYREKSIIVFDDLSDKGSTLHHARDYFELCEFTNVKFATLYIKKSTKFTPNYYVQKFDDELWLDFPWETVKLD